MLEPSIPTLDVCNVLCLVYAGKVGRLSARLICGWESSTSKRFCFSFLAMVHLNIWQVPGQMRPSSGRVKPLLGNAISIAGKFLMSTLSHLVYRGELFGPSTVISSLLCHLGTCPNRLIVRQPVFDKRGSTDCSFPTLGGTRRLCTKRSWRSDTGRNGNGLRAQGRSKVRSG